MYTIYFINGKKVHVKTYQYWKVQNGSIGGPSTSGYTDQYIGIIYSDMDGVEHHVPWSSILEIV